MGGGGSGSESAHAGDLLTCRYDDPLLLRVGNAGRGDIRRADAGLRVRGLVRHRDAVVAHVPGALGDAAIHRGLVATIHGGDIVMMYLHGVC